MRIYYYIKSFNRTNTRYNRYTLRSPPKISLATHHGDIVDSENAVKFEMGDALKLHGAQT